jgi:flagellar biosynthesis protein FliQ
MNWPEVISLAQGALLVAAIVSLPVLVAITGAGLLAGVLQSWLGHTDPATLVGPRLVGALLAVLLFGSWMLVYTADYWVRLWQAAAGLSLRP